MKSKREVKPPAAPAQRKQLKDYAARRAFEITPEPPPSELPQRAGPLMFVVQQHDARRLHFDFRLELDGVLKSWAVPKGPSLNIADKRLAIATEDHPFDYGSFEGVIPEKQYGAGEVIVWDCGVYSPDEDGLLWFHDRSEAERRIKLGLEQGKLSFQLRGVKLKGSFALVLTKTKEWLLIKHRDRFTQTESIIEQQPASVLCGLNVGDLRHLRPGERLPADRLAPNGSNESLPEKLAPMLATSLSAPFSDTHWLFEPKMDGYRVIAFIDGTHVKLQSRGGLDLTRTFPGIAGDLAQQSPHTMMLDGEILAFDAVGKPSFDALQDRAALTAAADIATAEKTIAAAYVCFDLLHFAGVNLRKASYLDRRRYLSQCLLPSTHVQLVHAEQDGLALYQAALAAGFEGMLAKKKSGTYEAGQRSPGWLKVKAQQSAEFVIGGYTKGKGSRTAFGALLVGYWTDAGKLSYAGRVGSGFDAKTIAALLAALKSLETKRMPFAEKPDVPLPTVWLRPVLVAEVRFANWTEDQQLRHSVFSRLRDDVDARKVRRVNSSAVELVQPAAETSAARAGDREVGAVLGQLDGSAASLTLRVGAQRVNLTNLDKVLWPAHAALAQPALTKRDLIRYLARVSPYMLPHLADRPLTMIRMPDGIAGERFFQKHWEQTLPPFAASVEVFSGTKNENHTYVVCNNLATLLWLGQLGCLEFHVWHSRTNPEPDARGASVQFTDTPERMDGSILNFPDYLVFDIDPYIYSGNEPKGGEPELNTPAFEKGKDAAFWLKELLEAMSLHALVKTSGKTGLHVFVPLVRTLDFDAARNISGMVEKHLARARPKDVTVEWSVVKRSGKVFMDNSINVRGKTLNVAYSPRGVAGAPMSMPLTWEELARAHPMDFRMWNIFDRLERQGDAWRGALTDKQSMEQALAALP